MHRINILLTLLNDTKELQILSNFLKQLMRIQGMTFSDSNEQDADATKLKSFNIGISIDTVSVENTQPSIIANEYVQNPIKFARPVPEFMRLSLSQKLARNLHHYLPHYTVMNTYEKTKMTKIHIQVDFKPICTFTYTDPERVAGANARDTYEGLNLLNIERLAIRIVKGICDFESIPFSPLIGGFNVSFLGLPFISSRCIGGQIYIKLNEVKEVFKSGPI